MMYIRNWRLLAVALAATFVISLGSGAALAQGFPSKDVTVIVPYAAGGGTDNFVRALQPSLEDALGTEVIVKNITGGGGAVGLMRALANDPDGYTVTVPNNAFFTLQGLGNVNFKYTDFDYIARITTEPYVLVVRNTDEWNDLASFVQSAKSADTQVKLGFAGIGSSTHIMTMVIANGLGLKPEYVPYDGGASAVAAAMGGHIDGVVLSPSDVVSAIEGDTLHALASTGTSSLLPNITLFSDVGYDINTLQWRGIAAPAGLESSVKAVWVDAVKEAIKDKQFQNAIQNIGTEIAPLYGDQLNHFVEETAELMIPLAKNAVKK